MPNRDRDRGDPLAEAINPVRGGTEDIVIVADDLAHRGDDLLIRRGDQAYRPIGAEHASLWAKPFQHPSHEGRSCSAVHAFQSASVTSPDSLQTTFASSLS